MKWLLAGILAIALFLRLISLASYPTGFTPDEAAIVYSSYTYLSDGRDAWGNFITLANSDLSYYSPLTSLLTVPFMASFGLVKESVRVVSALLGVGSVYIIYLLAKELGGKFLVGKKYLGSYVALISALLLAFLPWHIYVSRVGLPFSAEVFLISLGLLFFLKGIKYPDRIIISALIFGVALLVFPKAIMTVLLVVLTASLFFYKKLFNIEKRKLATAFVLVTVFFLFALIASNGPQVSSTNVYTNSEQEAAAKRIEAYEAGLPLFYGTLLHNKYFVTINNYISNFSSYFSYSLLFAEGPTSATQGLLPGRGLLYLFMLPAFLGIIYLFAKSKSNNLTFLAVLLLVTPAYSAYYLSSSAENVSFMMVPAVLLAAFGLVGLFVWLKEKGLNSTFFSGLILIVVLFSTFSFIRDYYLVSPLVMGKDMNYGKLEAAHWLEYAALDKEEVVISDKLLGMDIYIAVAGSLDPDKYREYVSSKQTLTDEKVEPVKLGKYVFKSINWNEDSMRDTLLVGIPEEFPGFVEPLLVIYYPNREPAIYIVDPDFRNYATNLW